MPRTSRFRTLTPETTYHVLARGNNRQTVFHAPADYEKYLRLFKNLLSQTSGLRCHHYCLMPNHAHLLLYAQDPKTFVSVLQRLQLSYAWYHRRTYKTSGHLWQGRYKSLPIIDDPYLLEAGRYIERNPLEAKLADTLEDYPWSSYRASALGHDDPLVVPSPAYLSLAATPQQRQTAWQQYVAQPRPYQVPSTAQLATTFQGG